MAHQICLIRKDYPLTGVLKLGHSGCQSAYFVSLPDQEGLPAYWGIETILRYAVIAVILPTSGRITRLLGY